MFKWSKKSLYLIFCLYFSVNADGLNVLEVAVMTGNASIVRTLQQAGATETNNGN